jgi:predicted P-loop ATPase
MIADTKYKYLLEKSPAIKGACPECGKLKSFRHYEGYGREYGICDHKNNCGYINTPKGEVQEQMIKPEQPSVKIVEPTIQFCQTTIKNLTSNFHRFCIDNLNITKSHLLKWNCGTFEDKTAFVYQNLNKQFVNFQHIEYFENCKRNKSKDPYSLKARKGEKYNLCLFGEHLLTNQVVCLVESEKTAIIASFIYPEFDWLATGGANKLTDEKMHVLYGRQIYYLNDADKAGKENSTIKKLKKYEQNFTIIDLFPDQTNGYDLADAIIDGLRPEIKPTIKEQEIIPLVTELETIPTVTENQTTKPPEPKSKNISDFEKVENFLTDRYEIRFNEVSNEIEFRNKGEVKPFGILNENNIYVELQKNFINFSQAKVTALLRSNYVTYYNPFNDYFESLPEWQETETDYIAKVCDYLPIKETDKQRFQTQFKKMLVRCIACALLDNVFNKQAFILVHDQQNSGKSTFCRWLCPPLLSAYITENISTDKDSLITLSDNLLVNMDELATLNKAELNTLKAMMSKDVVKVRRPYDKKPILTPRRASFVGSTNKSEFLSDETGSVRWLCFELNGRLNFDYKKDIDINDLWKQAYTLFKQGFKYELTPDEIQENEKANRAYQLTTEEQELIQKNYLPGTKDKHEVFYTSTDIKNALLEKYNSSRLNNINIGKALKILGFKQEQKYKEGDYYQTKGYYMNFLRE